MKIKILELLDFKKIDALLDGFKKTTGLATAILDLEGGILSNSEWRKLCTDFYQKNPETANWCSEIKIELAEKLAEGEEFHFYKCSNGLIEVAIPILIEGKHFANLFSGLFFFEEPDFDLLNSERKQYCFEEIKYNEALHLIPVIPLGKIKTTMEFLLDTIQFIIELAFQKAKEMELNDSLATNKSLVNSIIDNSPALIYVSDLEGKFKLANNEFGQVFDLPKSEIVGKYRQEIMPAEIAKQHRSNDLDVIKLKKPIVIEEENLEADGKHFYLSQKFPLFNTNGKIHGVGGISTDITEKKRTEEDLLKSKNKYKSLFDNSADGILVLNEQSEILELNNKICEILDYSHEELSKLKGFEIIHSEDLANKDHAAALEELQKGKTIFVQYRLRKKDGSYIHAELSTKMIAEGQFLNIVRDITDRKKSEKSIQESEEKFKKIFLTSPGLVTISQINDGKYIDVNDNFIQISGHSREEIIGKTSRDINIWTHLEDRNRMISILKEFGKVENFEAQFTLKNGRIADGLLSAAIFEIKSVPHILTITRDITDLKLAQQSLIETAANLSSMIDNREDFIWSIDRNFNYIIFNNTYEKIINKEHNIELKKGMSSTEILSKDEADFWIPKFNSVFEGENIIFEFSHVLNKELHYFQTSLNPILEGNIITGASGLSVDITKQKLNENALKTSEEKFEKVFRLSPYLVSLTNMEGQVFDVNDRIFSTLGYTREEFLGNNTTNLQIWANTEEREYFTNLLIKDESVHEMEVNFRKKSGEIGNYLVSACTIEISERKLFLSIIHDITERKQKEKALRESEERYRDLFENSYAIMLLIDPENGNIVGANPAASTFYGWSNLELTSMNISQINHKTNKEIKNILKQASKNDQNHFFFDHVLADSSIRNIEAYSAPIFIDGKKILYSIVHDVTDRNQMEKALVNEKNLLSTIIDNIPVMLTRYDPGKNVLYLNKEFEDKTGWKTAELETINLMERVYPDPSYREMAFAHMQKYNSEWEEFVLHSKTGDLIDSEWCNILLSDGTQIGIGIDITEEKKIKAEILSLNAELENKVKLRTAQLEAMNKELGTFTYSVSHDLKAPLRGIDGYSKLLADVYKKDLDKEAQSFIQKIRNSTLQMNQIIDDLLDYSRLERSQLNIGNLKIKDLVQSVLSIYTAALETDHFKINTKIADVEIRADAKGFIIALRNLIENSIKFTKARPNPTINIETIETELSWIISVNDNGIGFDMQYHHKIFDIFQRLQRAEDYPGTGIGLALVSKAMQRMNGKAWAESVPNVGSTFYLEIPKNQ